MIKTTLFEFDEAMRLQYGDPLCGTDEAGRGPLAGPVFAAAVILPPGLEIIGLNDSKKLTAARREALFDEIVAKSLACAVASVGEEDIDNLNILNASMAAMAMAVAELDILPAAVLVDGNRAPKLDCQTVPVVKGDGKSACIAAASILAKVSRDRYMDELSLRYPEYGFEGHKGYPTKLHYERILTYGISPVHRVTFLKNIEEKRREFEGKGPVR
ncbi:MAG TPA: ribonuclease HII [Terriglobales bacterium]|nr:ribonuclease HII [Terriglobales bacterium]